MKPIFDFFVRLAKSGERRERQCQEAYLAESTDLYDIEYRMRELDRESQLKRPWMGSTGS